MNTCTFTPIEILQNIVDECCEQHDQCKSCHHILSCQRLWDRLSEQISSKPLSLEDLRNFLDDFNLLWEDEYSDSMILEETQNKEVLSAG